MSATLFISYRRNNGQFYAQLLHALLEKRKYTVFLDKESLHQGRFDEQIFRYIEECDYFLLLLTPGAFDRIFNESDWMRMEIEHAFKCQKKIIPIIDERFSYPKFLPESINILPNYQSILTNTANPDQLNFVVHQIEGYIPASSLPKNFILAGLALILLLVGFIFAGQSTPVDNPEIDTPINASHSTIRENNRTIKGSYNTIIGNGNTIIGNYNKIHGNNNKVTGDNNKMYGRENKIISGNNNKIYQK